MRYATLFGAWGALFLAIQNIGGGEDEARAAQTALDAAEGILRAQRSEAWAMVDALNALADGRLPAMFEAS